MTAAMEIAEFVELGLPAHDSVAQLDRRARQTFAKVPPSSLPDSNDVLSSSALFLDQWRALAAIAEAVDHLGAREFGEVYQRFNEILDRARLFARIDVIGVFLQDPVFRDIARRSHRKPNPTDPFPIVPSPLFVRAVSSLIEFCPIDELVALGNWTGQPPLGHRCRLSYDWLRAFVRRHTPGEQETFHIVGRAYSEGRLSLRETQHLLSMPSIDAVAWLEEYGYAHDVDVVLLDEKEYRRRLAAMRQDRVNRRGAPVSDPDRVTRNVVATQRIEGVDARPWIQPSA